MVTESLKQYIDNSILPMYDDISCQREQSQACLSYAERSRDWSVRQFDAAHRRDHVDMVIEQSMEIARQHDVNLNMVYTIAAYHDTGLIKGRKQHHIVSGQIVREDAWLGDWFDEDEIETIAQAVEDHRASSDHEPRSIYGNYRASESKDKLARSLPSAADRSLKGNIVAEADRFIDPDKIIIRTVQYGLEHYPELDKDGHYKRTVAHMYETRASASRPRLDRGNYADGGYLKLWFPDSPNAARLEALRAIIRDERELRNRFNAVYDYFTNPHPQQCDCENCRPKYRKIRI